MVLDAFDLFKHNLHLSPVTSEALEKLGERCRLDDRTNVLDAACGKGGTLLTLAKRFGCTVTGMESRPEFAEEARRRALFEDLAHLVNVLDGDPGSLPFDDGFFDTALLLAPPRPFDSEEALPELSRVVRPGGWLVLSELVWRPGASAKASDAVREWLGRSAPAEILEMEGRRARFQAAGFPVESAEMSGKTAWEGYLAPQAHAILENRKEHRESAEALATLDAWQEELEIYHRHGGREALDYALFLLRRP
ncbi:MAG: class I SAM-dependent methyltransferase [bacterium]